MALLKKSSLVQFGRLQNGRGGLLQQSLQIPQHWFEHNQIIEQMFYFVKNILRMAVSSVGISTSGS